MKTTCSTRLKTLFAIGFTASLLTGCFHDDNGSTAIERAPASQVPLSQLQLQSASDCADLKQYVVDSVVDMAAYIPRYSRNFCSVNKSSGGNVWMPQPQPGTAETGAADSTAGTGAAGGGAAGGGSGTATNAETRSPADVSDTNNQESGVNEGDIVKTDAEGNLFVLSGRHFIVADGFPAESMNKLAEIDLGARGVDLFLDKANKRVITVARADPSYYYAEPVATGAGIAAPLIYPGPVQNYFIASFFDVTNPADPVVVEQIRFQGNFREGRRIDQRLHLVSGYNIDTDGFYSDTEFQTLQREFSTAVQDAWCKEDNAGYEDVRVDPAVIAARGKLAGRVSSIVDVNGVADYLPRAFRNAVGGSEETPYLACEDVNYPDVKMRPWLQVVASIDTNGANLSSTGIVANAGMTYASKNNLYLADTSRNWFWLSRTGRPPLSQTVIYKFNISAQQPRYVATGSVDGYALNQFSFSEHNNALRIATTLDDWFEETTDDGLSTVERIQENRLAILQDDGTGKLEVTGEVKGIAPGETIRSARFLGDRGFIVTFRNIDPLFTFNLSNPAAPKQMGELEITGFSIYMHPVDDTHLLTIGKAGGADGTGVGSGFKLQLFDVSDLTAPVLMHSHEPSAAGGWSSSSAEYDHKAFTYYPPAGLLAIPMRKMVNDGSEAFNGIVAFNVSLDTGFEELGRVDHSDLAYQYYCQGNPGLSSTYAWYCDGNDFAFWAETRRSVVITDTNDDVFLYTISDMGLKAGQVSMPHNTMDEVFPDLSVALGTVLFPPRPYYYARPLVGGSGGGIAVDVTTPVLEAVK